MVRHPLLLPTACFAGGIAVAEYWPLPLAAAWSFVLLTLVAQAAVALGQFRHPFILHPASQTAAAAAAFLALGLLALRIPAESNPPSDLRHLTPTTPILSAIRGEIAETPVLQLTERRGKPAVTTTLHVRVNAWRPMRAPWQVAGGTVQLHLQGALPAHAFRGRSLEAHGVLQAPPTPDAPGMFNYSAFLQHQDIHRILRVERPEDVALSSAIRDPPWSERFLPWAHSVLSQGVPDDESTRLLRAMALGWKTPLGDDVDDIFMRAGTMHVFAISGLHIALLLSMSMRLLQALRMPRLGAGALALTLTWGYVIATGWQPSSVRSALMASVVLAGETLHRPSDLLNSLAGAAAVILFLEPGQLFQAGFQLSFGVVAGLALLTPPLEKRFLSWIQLDPWVPEALRPRWQQRLASPLRAMALNLAVGIAAFLSALPLTVHHFNLVSPISLLANLLVVPLSSLALAATTASLAVAPIAPWLSEHFNASGWLWMRGMIDLSRWFADCPGGWWSVSAPPWLWWTGWYLTLGLAHWCETQAAWRLLGSPWPTSWIGRCASGLVVWALLACGAWGWHARIPRILVFRHEPGLFAQTPQGAMLFDGGRTGTGRKLLLPLLRANGVNRLELHLVSQGLQRFCGAGRELLEDLPPATVWVPPLNPSRQPVLRQYLTTLKQFKIPIQTAQTNRQLGEWTVLATSSPSAPSRGGRAADHAPVLSAVFAGVRVLWLGGASHGVQQQLLEDPRALQADVVIATASGGIEPLLPALSARLHPRLVVIATAPFPNAARLPRPMRDRLSTSPFPVLFTDELGGIQLEFVRGQVRWQAFGAPQITEPTREHPPAGPRNRSTGTADFDFDIPPAKTDD